MSLDFVAIDFETANRQRGSVCAVGLAKFADGVLVDKSSWLVQPPPGYEGFDTYNIHIHGITEADVEDAPTWGESADRIIDVSGGLPFAAHNAAFDASVARHACEAIGYDAFPDIDHCTMKLAKQHLGDEYGKLTAAAKYLELPDFKHHDAGDDALECGLIAVTIANRISALDIETLWPAPKRRAPAKRYNPYPHATRLPEAATEPVIEGPLNGRRALVTGKVAALERAEVWATLAKYGCAIAKNWSRNVDTLIVGVQDPKLLKPGQTRSSKEIECEDRIAEGQQVWVIREDEYLALTIPGRDSEPTVPPKPVAAPAARKTQPATEPASAKMPARPAAEPVAIQREACCVERQQPSQPPKPATRPVAILPEREPFTESRAPSKQPRRNRTKAKVWAAMILLFGWVIFIWSPGLAAAVLMGSWTALLVLVIIWIVQAVERRKQSGRDADSTGKPVMGQLVNSIPDGLYATKDEKRRALAAAEAERARKQHERRLDDRTMHFDERRASVRGFHYTQMPETIKQLKRDGKYDQALDLLHDCIAAAERDRHGREPAPWYTTQAAIIYRKRKEYAQEIRVLERWESMCPPARRGPGGTQQSLIKRKTRANELLTRQQSISGGGDTPHVD